MGATEKFSSPEVLSLLNLSLFLFGREKERNAARLGTFAYGISLLTALSLKMVFNRKRPEGDYPRWNSSFPSCHTATFFSLATVFAEKYPSMKIPFYGLASIIGFSRVYLGKHYPSDVLTGAILGYLIGKLVLANQDYFNKLHF